MNKFLGFAYFTTNLDLYDMPHLGFLSENSNGDLLLYPYSDGYIHDLIIDKLDLTEGLDKEKIMNKITSRPHKVFTRDWPKELFPKGKLGIWPFGAKRKYRVAIYDFDDAYIFEGKSIKNWKKIFKDKISKYHGL